MNMHNINTGLSLAFLTLAIVYAIADFAIVFDINDFSAEWKAPAKFALSYVMSYYRILGKALIVLFFVFVFIIMYDLVLIGVITPFVSDNIDSKKNISKFAGVAEIIGATKDGYFQGVAKVASLTISTLFGFISLKFAILLLVIVFPIVMFCVSFVYYSSISNVSKIDDTEEQQNILKTSFHFISIFMFCILFCIFAFLIYSVVSDYKKN